MSPEPTEALAPAPAPAPASPRWLLALLVLLVVQRVAYHGAYLGDDPFALATFSDGRLYERAAVDIHEAPPLGTAPFYLQGVYAYILALGMVARPGPAMGLLVQLVLVGLGLWAFYRAVRRVHGSSVGTACTVLLLAFPGLAFYENKYLTAALAEVSLCLMLGATAWLVGTRKTAAAVAFGAATGLAILARGNMLLGLPFFAWAVLVVAPRGSGRRRLVLAAAGGLVLALAPMAVRNATVTGRATVFPAHGGGTSFYIGNNRHARGVWNDAGGLLSGDVGRERDELVERLGVAPGTEAEQAAAIGRALYRRSLDEMTEAPGSWIWLEVRKAWLLTGADELAQDYDPDGEAELVPPIREIGLPITVLLGLGVVGLIAWRREDGPHDEGEASATGTGAWRLVIVGQLVAIVGANLLFFTSAQHRAPLAVPLAALAGPAFVFALRRARDTTRRGASRAWPLLLVAAIVGQGAWPRSRATGPSAAHYHNLALVQVEIGDPRGAVSTLGRALKRKPDHPVILIERITLQRQLGQLEQAAVDLQTLSAVQSMPGWVRQRAADEARRVAALRGPTPTDGGTEPR